MCIQAEYSTRTLCISIYMLCTMLVGQTFVLSWSRGGKAHRGGLLVGVVGTKTELSLLLVCGNEKLGELPLVVVCGNAKGNLSRQGSIITSLQVTLDCSAVSQLARLDPSTVSAVSVSAGILLFLSRDSLCFNTDTNSETKPTSQMTSVIRLRKARIFVCQTCL